MTTTGSASLVVGEQLNGADDALIRLGRALKLAGYRFTTVTPANHERVNRQAANATARDLRYVFGWSRPFASDEAAAQRLAGTDLSWTYHDVDPDVYGEELDGAAYARAERIAVVLLTATRAR
jgi:hypothetical protein